MAYVIEYFGTPPCWIAAPAGLPSGGFDVTFQRPLAQRFATVTEARNEILRLGLRLSWNVTNVGELEEKKEET